MPLSDNPVNLRAQIAQLMTDHQAAEAACKQAVLEGNLEEARKQLASADSLAAKVRRRREKIAKLEAKS